MRVVLPMLAVLVCSAGNAGVIRPLTDVATGETGLGDLDDAGAYVYAVSASDPLGTNPAHRPQIFRWASATGVPEQLTFYPAGVEPTKPAPRTAFPCPTPSVSDDGVWLAFVSRGDLGGVNPDGSEELFLLATDGSQLRQLTSTTEPGASIPCFRLSGSATRAAFVTDADLLGQNALHRMRPFVVDADGTNLRQLISNTSDTGWVSISDDGSRIAFDQVLDAWSIWGIQADGSGLHVLAPGGAFWAADLQPEVSGDGSRVAFSNASWYSQVPCGEYAAVASVPWAGGTPVDESLTCDCSASGNAATAWMPSIRDDGAQIHYTSDGFQTFCNFNVLETTAGPTYDQTVLTPLHWPAGVCRWSRASGNGAHLAVICEEGAPFAAVNPDHGPELFVFHSDRSAPRPLSSGRTGGVSGVAITADGTKVAFGADSGPLGESPSPVGQVYRKNADGSGLTAVTAFPGGKPAVVGITDDGQTILFLSDYPLLGEPFSWPPPSRLYAVQADGTALRRLSHEFESVSWVDVAGNGSVAVFYSDGTYAVQLDGAGRRLLDDEGGALPSVDATGTFAAWMDSYSNQILRRRVDLATPAQVLYTPPADRSVGRADISANGSTVAFIVDGPVPDGGTAIHVWSAGTTTQLVSLPRGRFELIRIAPDASAVFATLDVPYFDAGRGQEFLRIALPSGAVERVLGVRPCGMRTYDPMGSETLTSAFGVSTDGSVVPFVGTRSCDGANPDGNAEVFVADWNAAPQLRVSPGPAPTHVTWDVETGPASYDVIRGDVAELSIDGAFVDLGPVVCLENDSPDPVSSPDAAAPSPGQVFFYVTRGSAGSLAPPSNYGLGSGTRPRRPRTGGCAD